MAKDIIITPGGIDEYIAGCPIEAQDSLNKIRSIIVNIAPDALETVSYFQIPGYSYEGYDYNGMFVWFSYKKPFVRLHVRPPVIDNHKDPLANYTKTKSIVSFGLSDVLPDDLIKSLVTASLKAMKDTAK